MRTENAGSTGEQRALDAAYTGTAAALLLVQFARATGKHGFLLGIVRALTLVCKELLHIQPYDMSVRLNAENAVI